MREDGVELAATFEGGAAPEDDAPAPNVEAREAVDVVIEHAVAEARESGIDVAGDGEHAIDAAVAGPVVLAEPSAPPPDPFAGIDDSVGNGYIVRDG